MRTRFLFRSRLFHTTCSMQQNPSQHRSFNSIENRKCVRKTSPACNYFETVLRGEHHEHDCAPLESAARFRPAGCARWIDRISSNDEVDSLSLTPGRDDLVPGAGSRPVLASPLRTFAANSVRSSCRSPGVQLASRSSTFVACFTANIY